MINWFCLLLSLFWNSVLQNEIDKTLEFLVDFPSWYFEENFSLGCHLLVVRNIRPFRPLYQCRFFSAGHTGGSWSAGAGHFFKTECQNFRRIGSYLSTYFFCDLGEIIAQSLAFNFSDQNSDRVCWSDS